VCFCAFLNCESRCTARRCPFMKLRFIECVIHAKIAL
jgi:hypothetical protein